MNASRLTLFKFIFKPATKWAAGRAMVGRNRSRHEPEKGRFIRAEVNQLVDQAWQSFDVLAPDVSKQPTFGSKLNVLLASLTFAFLQNLIAAGVERDYAIELIGDICWKVYQWWGYVGRFLARLSRHDRIKDHARRVRQDGSWPMSFPFNPPGYQAQYVPTEQGLGFNVIRCPVAEYLRAQGASDLAVSTWCMLDYALAEMIGLRLVRTGTLAAGDKRCDFRWFPADKVMFHSENPRTVSLNSLGGE